MQNDQFWDQIYNVDDYMKQSDKVRKRNNVDAATSPSEPQQMM